MKAVLDPVTQKRLRRFREFKRAWWSFWILAVAYAVSLASELVCNSRPLFVKAGGRMYFPVLRNYTENDFLGNGVFTRPDYKAIRAQRPDAKIVFPLIPYGPMEILRADSIHFADTVVVTVTPDPRMGTIDVRPDLSVARAATAGFFFGVADDAVAGQDLAKAAGADEEIRRAVADRFANRASPSLTRRVREASGGEAEVILSPYAPRAQPPKTVRLTLSEALADSAAPAATPFDRSIAMPSGFHFGAELADKIRQRFEGEVAPVSFVHEGVPYRATFAKEEVWFPMRPVPGHPLGVDRAGRDVLARMIYGLRTSVTFGLLLVVATMVVGTLIGAWQGYHGGWRDIVGQRLTEIWDSLPFLYIIMLLGSVFGRSFLLLIGCYGLFMWIGISYYMRGEFLRLRRLPFVEAAKCLGLPKHKIIFRHILPNALVPIITFFPFSLVGAVGSLAALDYLGFGLPPPTPSWGEMLSQAQDFPWAWWLVLYPALALFFVMLLCVFIGEGVRAAFDPRRFAKME